MRLLIDANILLDVLQNRTPHCRDSAIIWKSCEIDKTKGFVSTLSFANLVYVMRKELDADQVEDILKKLSLIFDFADLTENDILKAAEMCWDDFEDAVQAATAERIHADYIVTRNLKDFENSCVPAIEPKKLIKILCI